MRCSGKIDVIVYMRVLAMTMIVLFHSLLFYTGTWWKLNGIIVPIWVKLANFLDAIDLSMFVFISGFLYGYLYIYKNKYRDNTKFLKGKILRLLIPYLFWSVMMVIFQPSLNDPEMILTGFSHLWFLLMLFNIFMITLIVYPLKLDRATPLFSVVFIVVLYIVWMCYYLFSVHHSFLCICSSLSYSISFFLGFFSAKMKIWECSRKLAICFAISSFTFLFCYFVFYQTLGFFANDMLIRVLSYTFIVSLFVCLKDVVLPTPYKTVLLTLDKLSMGLYIFNQIVINYVLLIPFMRGWLIEHYMVGPFILFVISFFVPLILSGVFNRYRILVWTIGGA